MQIRKINKIILIFLLISYSHLKVYSYTPSQNEVIPIVNNKLNINGMKISEIRNIFTLKITRWENTGKPIKLVILPDNDESTLEFILIFLDYPGVHNYFRFLNFNNQNNSIIWVNNMEEAIKEISKNDNYIGYVKGNFIFNNDGVKILKVIDNL